jgi:hypothetical protein
MSAARTLSGVLALGLTVMAGASLVAARDDTAPAAASPTFTKDVAPIFQEKCQSCHRPGYIAPMSLVTYEDSRPWARSIKSRVASRQMPPWHIDKTVGIQHFKNDRSLSDEQIDTIVRWVDAGAPKGDAKDMPPPKQFADDSVWGFAPMFGQTQPDLVLKSKPYTVKAVQQDAWWRPATETGVTEPRWVRAIEIRPSTVAGRKVTHHALARLQQDEGSPRAAASTDDDDAVGQAGLFMEWAVGKQGEIMRPNTGKLMLPGSKIVWDIHYHAVGEEIADNTVEIGIYFYPKGQEPKFRQTLALFNVVSGGSRNIDIPPNSTFTTQSVTVLRQSGRMENFQPHMHLRGKAMMIEAIYPDGRSQVLSYVNNYNFNWHVNYIYADEEAPLLPKGTMLKLTAWYDNTASNRNNPDPNQWVGYGDRTVDEMGHAWINITYMNDEDFKAEVEKRKAQQSTTVNQPQR